MAEENERDLPSTQGEDDLDEIEAMLTKPDAAIEALKETDPDKARELEIARLRDANLRLLGRQKAQQLRGYAESLVKEEFPYAPIDLVTGTSKREIRRSAERLHNHNKTMLETLGLTPEVIAKLKGGDQQQPGEATTEAAPGQPSKKTDPAAWGAAPSLATEATASATVPDWGELRGKAERGEVTRADLLRQMAEDGPRVITRPSLGANLSRRHAVAGPPNK